MILLSRRRVLPALLALSSSARLRRLGPLAFADAAPSAVASTPRRRPSPNGGGGEEEEEPEPPFVRPRELIDGEVVEVEEGAAEFADVYGCCSSDTESAARPDGDGGDGGGGCPSEPSSGALRPALLGRVPQMTTSQSLSVLNSAVEAWDGGSGTWPQMSLGERIAAVERFLTELKKVREEAVRTLMWEIGKNRGDAEAEFDRTVGFVYQTIDALRSPTDDEYSSEWRTIGSTRAFVRRGPLGVVLCLGPFNYPLNETYATMIPALLMGNVVIMKIPTVGGLVHMLTMEAFARALPPGAIHFISGSGRSTMPPLMETGKIDGLAFIGGSGAADDLIRKHPEPHRLKTFLQLEAKNMAVFLPDLFEGRGEDSYDGAVASAIDEAVAGALSYNGQRCTAIKILFVPAPHARGVALEVARRVDGMRVGLPWQTFESEDDDDDGGDDVPLYAQITPLPNRRRVEHMRRLIDDALSKGAEVLNADGGTVLGGEEDSTLMIPAVLYPATPDMDAYAEEQFGPVVPIAPYGDLEEVLAYGRGGRYGQQASIFARSGGGRAHEVVDAFSAVLGRINVNSQCARSPDSLPFSGRRSSAMGVMSVTEALREFSVPTVVAYKDRGDNERIAGDIQERSKFMASL